MFDKKLYWKRRKQGLPGIENLTPEPKVVKESGVEMQMTRKGLVAMPRYKRRRKLVDRTTTKKGHVYGTKIGSKMHGILETRKRRFIGELMAEKTIVEEKDGKVVGKKYIFPRKSRHLRPVSEELRIHRENNPLKIDPKTTNHQRNLARKEKRDADKSARRAASSAARA